MKKSAAKKRCDDTRRGDGTFQGLLLYCMHHYRSACASLACQSFWQLSFFQSPALRMFGDSPLGGAFPLIFLLAASVAVYCAGWRYDDVLMRLAARSWCSHMAGVCMIGGTICQGLALVPGAPASLELMALASMAMGVGAACYVIGMGCVFAQWGPRMVLGVVSVAQFVAVLALLVLAFLPLEVEMSVLILAAAGAWGFFMRTARKFPKGRLLEWGVPNSLATPKKLVVTCIAQGVALGAMSVFGASAVHQGEALAVTAVAFALGMLLVAVTAGAMRMDFNHLLYQVTFPLMGLGFLVSTFAPGNTLVATFIFMVAHCYAYIVIVCINAYFSRCLKCSPTWIVSLTTCSMAAGQAVSIALLSILAGLAFWGMMIVPLSATMAFLAPTAALWLFNSKNPASGWGAISPVRQRETDEEVLFVKIASDYRLTTRETEITEFLARGRNKRVISQELGLSEETVKTHMGNVYRKLGIHSQQELIDLVEAERDTRDR